MTVINQVDETLNKMNFWKIFINSNLSRCNKIIVGHYHLFILCQSSAASLTGVSLSNDINFDIFIHIHCCLWTLNSTWVKHQCITHFNSYSLITNKFSFKIQQLIFWIFFISIKKTSLWIPQNQKILSPAGG